jgi:hypothetical protein
MWCLFIIVSATVTFIPFTDFDKDLYTPFIYVQFIVSITLIIFKQRFVERSKCNTYINTLNARYKSRYGEDATRRLVLS